jgi:ATP-dependent DNA helicase RecQ
MIFGNHTLQDMARKVPRTPAQFSRVSGVGRAKLGDLGGAFLELINAYARERGWADTPAATGAAASSQRPQRVVNQSYRETGQLISEGASLEQVAEARNLTVGTILGHLERLVEESIPVELAHLLPPSQDRSEIEAVLETMGENPLRPVWEELEGRFSYDVIRLVRLNNRRWEKLRPSDNSGHLQPDPRSMMRR